MENAIVKVEAPKELSTEQVSAVKEAEEKRQADVEHRVNVESEVNVALEDIIGSEALVADVMVALVGGKIPHVTINY